MSSFRKPMVLGISVLMVSIFMLIACASDDEDEIEPVPPFHGGASAVNVEVTCDEFAQTSHLTSQFDLDLPRSLVVTLCSNPTTGFQWNEMPEIDKPDVLDLYEHNYVTPADDNIMGAPGKDVWTFKALKQGSAMVRFDYSRPWEGGEKSEWTFTLVVNINGSNNSTLPDGTWILESYGPRNEPNRVLENTEITALFDQSKSEVNGSAGCNSYSGTYNASGSEISISDVVQTEMGCLEPNGIMEQETQYLHLLRNAQSFEVSGGFLEISCWDDNVLQFRIKQ